MSVNGSTDHPLHRLLRVIATENRRPRQALEWDAARLEVLQGKADADRIASFERSCARGQLAAAAGDFITAEYELTATLREFDRLYPSNGHLFAHLLQLILAMQLTEAAALLLDDRFGKTDFFRVVYGPPMADPVVNTVQIDASGHCVLYAHPRMIALRDAEYFISHWQSSARIWASYCDSDDWVPGAVTVNSGEQGCAPGLAYCGNESSHILIPDGYFLGSTGYSELHAKYNVERPSWDRRQSKAFWRGATTGVRTGKRDWHSLLRVQLCKLSQHNSEQLDAALSSVVQTSADERHEIEAAGLVKGPVPPERFLHYKYQIDIDGNSNSWPGLYQRLLTSSPVLKVASPHGFKQWYYGKLKPWINFVPVDADMADLMAKIRWLQANDDQARAIGEAGLALARSLTYQGELASAHRTIRAVFLAQSQQSEFHYRIGMDGGLTPHLTQGWDVPGKDHVWALGCHSTLALALPALSMDYEVSLELEPHILEPHVRAQRVTLVANGTIVAERSLSERASIAFQVGRNLLEKHTALTIIILHPDAFAPCTYRPVTEDRLLSVALSAVSLTAMRTH